MSDSEDDMDLDKEIKISLVGESGTGKSMLCARYLGRAQCGTTQGADVLVGQCPPAQGGFGRHLGGARGPQLRLCDVSGHGRDAPMLRNYLYASNVIIFVYDITNLQSFELLALWLERVIEVAARDKYLPVVALFGNKSDLEHQRAIRMTTILKFASDNKMLNYFGSARTGDGVFGAFMSLIAHVMGVPISRSVANNSRASKVEIAITDKPSSNVTNTSSPNGATKEIPEAKEVPLILERQKIMEIRRKAVSAICVLQ